MVRGFVGFCFLRTFLPSISTNEKKQLGKKIISLVDMEVQNFKKFFSASE
jgi:hypothetical protein